MSKNTGHLEGLADEKFVEAVGPVVVATNAVIFNHLLTLLVARDQIEQGNGVNWASWQGAPYGQDTDSVIKVSGER